MIRVQNPNTAAAQEGTRKFAQTIRHIELKWGDAAGATLVRSTPPVVYAVVVPALFSYAKDGAPASVMASAV
jgi:hypothetical protein